MGEEDGGDHLIGAREFGDILDDVLGVVADPGEVAASRKLEPARARNAFDERPSALEYGRCRRRSDGRPALGR
jgi:hypothetical protein